MATYLDIGCVRIQSWIGQWSDLMGRRGASAALNDATTTDTVEGYLRQGDWPDVSVNTTVPDVDGVVSLVVGSSTEPEVVARLVLAELRARVPGAEFEAVWGRGGDYAAAYEHEIQPGRQRGEVMLAVRPPGELPMVARCDLVSTDLAVDHWTRAADEQRRRIGGDAQSRIRMAGFRSSLRRSDGTALDTELALAEEFDREEVKDFAELAALGPPRLKRNHLATVYLDGNRIGDQFQSLRPNDTDNEKLRAIKTEARRSLSSDLHDATVESLRAATGHLCELVEHDQLPVVPHIVGGDDIIVSVPAAYGVWFARCLMTEFSSRMGEAGSVAGLVSSQDDGAFPFSASAGIAIAHASYPFGDCVAAADDLLSDAKAATRGTEASLLIAELTTDSTKLPGPSEAWTLRDLVDLDEHLVWLAGCGKSQRAELQRAAGRDDPQVARAYVERLLRRSDDLARIPPALIADPQRLIHALNLTRWWT